MSPVALAAGGHRRIPIDGLVEFLRRKGFDPKRPDLLGLPAGARRDDRALVQVVPAFAAALREGSFAKASSILFGLHLAGRPITELCDRVIAPAFRGIGHSWERGELEVYRERRAVEVTQHALYDLRRVMVAAPAEAPVAISATFEGDPYTLPIAMCQLVLRDAGWSATSLGPNLPPPTVCSAIEDLSPRLLCLNVSYIVDVEAFVAGCAEVYEVARAHGTALAIGGQALSPELRARIRYTAVCTEMAELVGLADSL